jgi:hypothetical protein
MVLFNTPLVCEMLKNLREKKTKPNAAGWLIVSFFHDDEELVNAGLLIKPATLLKIKQNQLFQLAGYPFVNKITIPYGCEITPAYLNQIRGS